MADPEDDAVIATAVRAVMDRKGYSSGAARAYLTYMADGIEVATADFARLFLFAIDYTDNGLLDLASSRTVGLPWPPDPLYDGWDHCS